MKKLAIALLAGSALITPVIATPVYAQSSFRPAQPQPLENDTNLECVPVQSSDTDRRDPVYKISVNLSVDDDWKPTDLTVIHYSISGASYNRADQYTRSDLTQTPGRTDYYWRGTWIKDAAFTMVGNLVRTATNNWTYSERQFKYGRLRYYLLSACHNVEPPAPRSHSF
jgi:hypothetical protein